MRTRCYERFRPRVSKQDLAGYVLLEKLSRGKEVNTTASVGENSLRAYGRIWDEAKFLRQTCVHELTNELRRSELHGMVERSAAMTYRY